MPTTSYGGGTYGGAAYADPVPGRLGTYAWQVAWDPAGWTPYDTLPAPNGPLRCAITRGRTSDLGPVAMGTMTVTVEDRAGALDPSNAASPLVAAGLLRPLRRGQLVLYPAGSAVGAPLFTGYLSRAWADPDATVRRATLEFVDGFWLLEHAFPVVAATGPIRAGPAIRAVLLAAGVAAADTDLDDGGWLPEVAADGTQSALAVIAAVQQVDLGLFFCAASGAYAYRDRSSRYGRARAAPAATLAAAAVRLQVPGIDVASVVNQQRVQVQRRVATAGADRTSSVAVVDLGTPQSVADTAYLGRAQAGAPIASAYLRDETQANSLAQHVVATRKTADVPLREVTLPGLTLAAIQQQAALELSSAVALSGLGVASEGLVESIRHEITRTAHTTAYALTSRPSYGFTIGHSTIGGSDPLLY